MFTMVKNDKCDYNCNDYIITSSGYNTYSSSNSSSPSSSICSSNISSLLSSFTTSPTICPSHEVESASCLRVLIYSASSSLPPNKASSSTSSSWVNYVIVLHNCNWLQTKCCIWCFSNYAIVYFTYGNATITLFTYKYGIFFIYHPGPHIILHGQSGVCV